MPPLPNLFQKFICLFSRPPPPPIRSRSNSLSSPPSPKKPHSRILYIILPYFNYCSYESRTKLFLDFIKRIHHKPMIRIVVVEGTPKGKEFDLPAFDSESVFLHIKVELNERVWIKENLINLAVRNLPSDWNYMAWVDADITFLNNKWVQDTMHTLDSSDVVQMFHSAINLGPDEETLKVDKGFMYQHLKSGYMYHKNAKYGFWHPGYAWACNRHAYTKMGGLIDFSILGSGDRHMALALIGKVEYSHPGNIHLDYMIKLKEFQDRCKGLKINYIQGSILHHFHGSIADRRYQERWTILTKNEYSPIKDIHYDKEGILHLTPSGARLQPPIDAYFRGRNEDGLKT